MPATATTATPTSPVITIRIVSIISATQTPQDSQERKQKGVSSRALMVHCWVWVLCAVMHCSWQSSCCQIWWSSDHRLPVAAALPHSHTAEHTHTADGLMG